MMQPANYADFRCGLDAGFFAVVSLAAFLPEIGISISFWPAAALRGFLADVEFRRHLTRPADGEHSSGCDERRGSRKFHRCVTELAFLQRLDPSDLPDLGEQP
jgi:hypothetical protein